MSDYGLPPENLGDYVFHNHAELLTPVERAVFEARSMRGLGADWPKPAARFCGKKYGIPEEEMRAALQGEGDGFARAACERVLREHGDGFLNRCPKCGTVVRTPKARQCWRCFHRW